MGRGKKAGKTGALGRWLKRIGYEIGIVEAPVFAISISGDIRRWAYPSTVLLPINVMETP